MRNLVVLGRVGAVVVLVSVGLLLAWPGGTSSAAATSLADIPLERLSQEQAAALVGGKMTHHCYVSCYLYVGACWQCTNNCPDNCTGLEDWPPDSCGAWEFQASCYKECCQATDVYEEDGPCDGTDCGDTRKCCDSVSDCQCHFNLQTKAWNCQAEETLVEIYKKYCCEPCSNCPAS